MIIHKKALQGLFLTVSVLLSKEVVSAHKIRGMGYDGRQQSDVEMLYQLRHPNRNLQGSATGTSTRTSTVTSDMTSGSTSTSASRTTSDDDHCAKFVLDCTHTNDHNRHSTTDTITARIYRGSTLVSTQTFKGETSDGTSATSSDDEFCTDQETIKVDISDSGDDCEVDRIELSTDGETALLIDYIRLYWDGREEKQWGTNNGSAWCLSKDPRDNSNKWGSFLTSPEDSSFDVGSAGDSDDPICYERLTFSV